MQDLIIGQAAWRYRIGRDFEHLLSDVDRLSLTWKETEVGDWSFTLSIRRKRLWFKHEVVIDFIDEHDVRIAAFDLAHGVVRTAFPEVAKDEDERREKEGVALDE
jgi:hypothetical protein